MKRDPRGPLLATAVVLSLIAVSAIVSAGTAVTTGTNSSTATHIYSNITVVGAAVTVNLLNSSTLVAGPNSVLKILANVSSPITGDFLVAVTLNGSSVGPLLIIHGAVQTSLPQPGQSTPGRLPISISYPMGMIIKNSRTVKIPVIIKLTSASSGTVNLVLNVYQAQPQPGLPGQFGYDVEAIPFQLEVSA